jgi:DNA-binding IclR family transcriptional regulator
LKSNVTTKTFTLLRAFTDKQAEWGVNELSRYLDMPVSSVHRMISLLKNESILEYSETTGKYKIGTEMIRMASIIHANVDVKKMVRPFLEQLSSTLNESIYFSLYHPQHKKLSFIDSVKSSNALQFVLDEGILQPIYMAASGKSILAHLSDEEIESILISQVENVEVRKGIVDELLIIKAQGYAKTANERIMGALSIGAPVFDATENVIGSIICLIPISDYKVEEEETVVRHIVNTAKEFSSLLGYPVRLFGDSHSDISSTNKENRTNV